MRLLTGAPPRLFRVAIATAALLAAWPFPAAAGDAAAESLSGRAVRVADGDTFTLRTREGEDVVVRVAEIDAPELDQPHGRESRQSLAALVHRKSVRLAIQTQDAHGRTVARPYVGDVDVAAELLRSGAAWVYDRYLRDSTLPRLEEDAAAARRGLWRLDEVDRVPPWEWRRAQRDETQPRAASDGRRCDIKGNVSSRGERIYHLPGQAHYQETRISTSKGERWFCSEAEAQAAGWRRARTR